MSYHILSYSILSINGKRDMWEIRKINATHTCVSTCISQDYTKLNSLFIANCIIQLLSEDPGISIKILVKEVVTRFGYTVTYKKAWTAKQIAMSEIYGDWEGSYKELPPWLNATLCTSLLGLLRIELSQWCNAQSIYCIRHVTSNFNKEFKDIELKEKVTEMGYELMWPRFERMLDVLRQKNPRAATWLDNIPKEKWTQSYD
ncbi:hypothetical protein Lal_00019498 [Lupinus albus]|nr:hypothetical protein Lal_00019498 [Lupinus albus]